MTNPRNAAGPGVRDTTNSGAPGVGTEGDQKIQLAGCDPILGASPAERERRAGRARLARETERRRASAALDQLLAELYPDAHPQRIPSTYGMTDDQRLAYGRHLIDVERWQKWEIRAVLAAPGAGVAA